MKTRHFFKYFLALLFILPLAACSGDILTGVNSGGGTTSGSSVEIGTGSRPGETDGGENSGTDSSQGETGGDSSENSPAYYLKPFESSLYFGRSALPPEERKAYDVILAQILNFKNNEIYNETVLHAVTHLPVNIYGSIKINLESEGVLNMDANALRKILSFMMMDEPRLFHVAVGAPRPTKKGPAGNFILTGEGGVSYFWLELTASVDSFARYEEMLQTIEKTVEPIMKAAEGNYSDAQKAKILHDRYLAHVSYGGIGTGSTVAGNLRGSFYDKSSDGSYRVVCQGYAYGYQYLLQKAGIPSVYVVGAVDTGGGKWILHAWEKVKINGGWYHANITWDDSLMPGDTSSHTRYFMKADGDPEIYGSHKEQRDVSDQPAGYLHFGVSLPASPASSLPESEYLLTP